MPNDFADAGRAGPVDCICRGDRHRRFVRKPGPVLGPMPGRLHSRLSPCRLGQAQRLHRLCLAAGRPRRSAMASVSVDFDPGPWRPTAGAWSISIKASPPWRAIPPPCAFCMRLRAILEIHASRSVHAPPWMPRAGSAASTASSIGVRIPSPQGNERQGRAHRRGWISVSTPTIPPSWTRRERPASWRFGIPICPRKRGAPYGLGQVRYQAQLQADPAFGQHESDLHGTHVASCAAGSGPTNPFYGVAPGAALMGVQSQHQEQRHPISKPTWPTASNGCSMRRTRSKCPAWFNLSLGNSHIGPA